MILVHQGLSVTPKFVRNFVIAEPQEGDHSWVTLLVGENGTKKSLMLKEIFDDTVISVPLSRRRIYGPDGRFLKSGTVSQVIALSGTPLDRFPRLTKIRVVDNGPSKLGYKIPYTYFGQRASNGVVGSNQSERCLLTALLENRGELKSRETELNSIFGQLGLAAAVRVTFEISARRTSVRNDVLLAKSLIEKLRSFCDGICKAPGQKLIDIRDSKETIDFIDRSAPQIALARKLLQYSGKSWHVRIAPGLTRSAPGTMPTSVWRMLFEAGVLDIHHIEFDAIPKERKMWGSSKVPGSHLSSGQLSWLCTLAGLTAQISDDALVLIDEPENSLHPSWQRSYVPTLLRIIAHIKRCHVIVATHAPLIASGLPPSAGNVRRLRRMLLRGNPLVYSEAAESTFGWSATDAFEALFQLETTRASIFKDEAQEALQIVREKGLNLQRKKELLEVLAAHQQSLPEFDSMRHVLEQIISSLRVRIKEAQEEHE